MKADRFYQQCDLHVHTRFSPCAGSEMVIADIVQAAAGKGLRYLGITDHIYPITDLRILAESRREVNGIGGPVKVFVGCEADVLNIGSHTVAEWMPSKLDFVAIAANHFHNASFVAQPASDDLATVAAHYLAMFRYACSLEFVDWIAHPLFVYPGGHDPTCLELIEDGELAEAIELARTNEIAVEISPKMLARDQLYFRTRFCTLCKQAGLKFAIGSDAHRLAQIGRTDLLAPLVDELGITQDDIWLPGGGGKQ